MNINTIPPEEFERMTDQELNTQIEKACTDYSNEMKEQMKHALANVRAAMVMCNEGEIKSELRSAEHHLTR